MRGVKGNVCALTIVSLEQSERANETSQEIFSAKSNARREKIGLEKKI